MTLSETLDQLSDLELAQVLQHLEGSKTDIQVVNQKAESTKAPSRRDVLVAYYLQQTLSVDIKNHSKSQTVSGLNETELREHCEKRLPSHMCPVRFVALNQFPTLPNGKLAYNNLPLPEKSARSKPSTPAESSQLTSDSKTLELITDILKKLLAMEDIRASDNFFEIGGDSITAIQFISQARTAGLNVDISAVTESKSIADIASLAESTKSQTVTSSDDASKPQATDTFAASGLNEDEIDDFLNSLG